MSISIQPFDAGPIARRISPQRGYFESDEFPKRKNCFLFQFLISMNPRRVQAPQLQTPSVAIAGDVTVTVTVTVTATVTVTVSFSFYCITASVMLISVTGNAALSLWFFLPSLLRRRRRILRRVLGPEMKFKWICIGIRLNRLCKHFVSFHLRAFRFLGSLTVNSAMWMCESFPGFLPAPHPPRRQFVAMSRLPPLSLRSSAPRLAHFAPFDLPRRRWFSAFPLRSGKITLKSLKSWFRRSSNLHNSHMFELVCACLCLHAAFSLFSQLHLISRNCIYISIRYISVFMN